jgi:hypothetical protein
MPFCADAFRTAFAMFAFTSRKMPSAASTTVRPSGFATRSRIAAVAPSASSRIVPPQNASGLR